ncbi:MAG: hypothetical protein P1U61_02055 [Legionellaceae bacterium]|nr:hypothetical protein [Legionellaceae bacterium]
MITIGPFLTQSHTQELLWCSITLGGASNQVVWSTHITPFDTTAEKPFHLNEATIIPPSPFTLTQAFDPASARYLLLMITEEHELIQFRPLNTANHMSFLPAEQYAHPGWTPVRPIIHPPVPTNPENHKTLHEQLQKTETFTPTAQLLTLEAIAKLQYQNTQQPSPWHAERDNISGIDTCPESIKYPLTQNGFFLAWHDLKATSSSPLIYCYALTAVIHQNKQAIFEPLKAEQDTAELAISLRRYLFDPTLYKDKLQPLNQAFFDIIQGMIRTELELYLTQTPGTHTLRAITNKELLSFEAACVEYANTQPFSRSLAEKMASDIFLLIADEQTLTQHIETLNELHQTIQSLVNEDSTYDRIYRFLEEQFDAHFPHDNLTTALHLLSNKIQNELQEVHIKKVNACIALHSSDNEALTQALLPLLKTTKEAHFTLKQLTSVEQKNHLLDALRLENPESPFLQTAVDFFHLTKELPTKSIQHLFKKRSPTTWGKLLHCFSDLKYFCRRLNMPEQNRLFKANATHIAALTNSDDKIITLFNQINIEQLTLLIRQIPSSISQHWIQTPKQLKAFFSLEVAGAYKEREKVRRILSAIPVPYRVTVLVQARTPEQQASILFTATPFLFELYWNALSLEEWHLLFDTPNHLKALSQALLAKEAPGSSKTSLLIRYLPDAWIEAQYERFFTEENVLALPLGELTQKTALTDFTALKQTITSILQCPPISLNFFPVLPSDRKKWFDHAKNTAALKRELIHLYCINDNTHINTAISRISQLIQSYEAHMQQGSQKLTSDDEDTNGSPSKRLRVF